MIAIEEYQEWTLSTAVYPEAGKYTERELNYLIHGLTGEAGELANKFKKLLRSKRIILSSDTTVFLSEEEFKVLTDKLGNVLWYTARLCETLQTTIGTIMNENVLKLEARKATGEIKDHSSSISNG